MTSLREIKEARVDGSCGTCKHVPECDRSNHDLCLMHTGSYEAERAYAEFGWAVARELAVMAQRRSGHNSDWLMRRAIKHVEEAGRDART